MANRKYPDLVWMRCQVPDPVHAALRIRAVKERRTIIDLMREVLTEAASAEREAEVSR